MTDASPYRWYLCVQQPDFNWDCKQLEGEKALYPFCDFDYKAEAENPKSQAIPISKWKPRILDPLILHYSLHPKINLSYVTYPASN